MPSCLLFALNSFHALQEKLAANGTEYRSCSEDFKVCFPHAPKWLRGGQDSGHAGGLTGSICAVEGVKAGAGAR